ncbi:MAG: efflux RND transporter permease subunit [Candidatus Saccharimonas sp.]|nr:efflux RND transporter permease subunit [Planctomycetaceae bacterium]
MRPIGTELRLPLDEGMVMDMPITIPRASIAQSGDDLKARNMVLCRFPEVLMVTGKAGRADTPFDPAPLDMIETMIEFRARDLWLKRRLLKADAERIAARFLKELSDERLIDPVPHDQQHEIVDAAQFRFEAMQRETSWQLTQAFQTQLQHDLSRFVVDHAGRELHGSGRLVRALTPSDVAVVSQSLPAAAIRELALSPNEEALAALWPRILEELERQQLMRNADAARSSSASAMAEFFGSMGEVLGLERSSPETRVLAAVKQEYRRRWLAHVAELNRELHRRAVPTWLRLVGDECFARWSILDADLASMQEQIRRVRSTPPKPHDESAHHGLPPLSKLPMIDPHPRFDALVRQLTDELSRSLLLWPHDSDSLAGFGGEMDRALQMPGWTNVWTRPIQNRVDMLATGVNTEVGVRVLGRRLEDVVAASEQIAAVLKDVPGAADVVADPIRGKGVIQIVPDPHRTAELGVSLSDLQAVLEAALSGRVVSQVIDGRERTAVRLRIAQQSVEEDEESLRRLPIPCRPSLSLNVDDATRASSASSLETVPLEAVAQVSVIEGPATIKSENGWLRNYVRLNVRDRSPFDVVADARRIVTARVALPAGVFVEWTGQYEHAAQTRRTLLILMPCVLLIILAILFVTYRDWADAGLMLLSAPGALAGGVLCQWLLGYKFSIAVGVGYIACFGMAAATGIVMLVYLREAVERAGGLAHLTLPELKQAVLNGAVHRLRPKLLTEATTVLGLAPMLWSTGVGAEVIRPMAAPVLGGILIADEVIDLLLPVLFYHVRRRRWERLHRSMADSATADRDSSLSTITPEEDSHHADRVSSIR